jgi:formylmethanofuran dehydrogenase subunit E
MIITKVCSVCGDEFQEEEDPTEDEPICADCIQEQRIKDFWNSS